jgi:hypothetical protein
MNRKGNSIGFTSYASQSIGKITSSLTQWKNSYANWSFAPSGVAFNLLYQSSHAEKNNLLLKSANACQAKNRREHTN